jgi:hypothetical protein
VEPKDKKGKDPAFLFYYQDFFTGVSDLTNEEVGAYVRCLCIQASKGCITEKHMKNICSTYDVHNSIKNKFMCDHDTGNFYNERLRTEMEKRKNYIISRSNNRKAKKDMLNICSTYDEHMENENENENEIRNKDEDLSKKIKSKYGEYKHVLLTREEYDKLSIELGNDIDKWIKTLDEGIELKGYKYKSHYLAIKKWVKREIKNTKTGTTKEEIVDRVNYFLGGKK